MKNILKRYYKILTIFIMILMIFVCYNNTYATDSIIKGADNFVDVGVKGLLNEESIKKTSDLIYNVLLAIGTVIVLIAGVVLGIQFIMGSVEEKAKVQEALIPFIVGAVVIFGSFAIWKAIALVLIEI